MREVKFRAIRKKGKRLHHYFSLEELLGGMVIMHMNDYDISQYTGLKDRNNNDIYFDDILKMPPITGRVEFIPHWARISVGDYTLTSQSLEVSEVIGNIYEHQHLIKEEYA